MHLHAAGINLGDRAAALRHLHQTDVSSKARDALFQIPKLDEALDTHSKPAHETFHVYSGVGRDFNISKLREKHEKVHLPAFTSTSLDHKIAASFAMKGSKATPEILRIKIPKGSQHGTFIGSATFHDHENEFLMHRGKTIKFVGEPKIFKEEKYGTTIDHLVHTAEIVDD